MTIESVTYISDLDDNNPATNDPRVEGDDHIRNIKTGLLGTFPSFTGAAVSVTEARINRLGITTLGTVEASMVVITDSDKLVKNLLLDDATTFITDSDAITKQLKFDVSGANAATVMTVESSATVNRTITLPDATDTLVAKDTSDILTNKTLTSPVLNTGVSGTAIDSSSLSASSTKFPTSGVVTTAIAAVPVSPFTESYVSSNSTTVALDAAYQEAHGLSGTPKLVQVWWECESTDNGYAVGDRVDVMSLFGNAGESAIVANDTNVIIPTSSNWGNLDAYMVAKSGTGGAADYTKWGWVIAAYY